MKNNSFKYILATVLALSCNLLLIGSVFQSFLLESGLSEETVSVIESAFLILQSGVMALASAKVEKTKNAISSFSYSLLLRCLVFIPMLFFCIVKGTPLALFLVVMLLFKVASSVAEGFYSVVSYKVPYHIIDMADYGKITANSGFIGGIICIVLSAGITYLNTKLGFFDGMKILVAIGILIAISAFFVAKSMKKVSLNLDYQEKGIENKTNILKYKPFYLLLVPNLTRGICTGVLNVALIIGYHYELLDGESAALIAILTQIGTIGGAFAYSSLCKIKKIDGILVLIPAAVMLIAMPFMVNFGLYAFFISYLVAKFSMTIIDYAVPVAVVKIVDYDHIGRYSAYRMLTHTVGTAIGSSAAIFVIKAIGGSATMVLAGMCILVTGVAYYLYIRLKNKGKI